MHSNVQSFFFNKTTAKQKIVYDFNNLRVIGYNEIEVSDGNLTLLTEHPTMRYWNNVSFLRFEH